MIFICGNGGSATQADHFAAELISDGIACISLTNSANITAIANDYGYEHVFAHQINALGQPGDLLILLSTSGKSRNIAHAAIAAQAIGMGTILITGELRPRMPDITINLPGDTQEIQEYTLMILHRLWKGIANES